MMALGIASHRATKPGDFAIQVEERHLVRHKPFWFTHRVWEQLHDANQRFGCCQDDAIIFSVLRRKFSWKDLTVHMTDQILLTPVATPLREGAFACH